jgi:hypothetical protein
VGLIARQGVRQIRDVRYRLSRLFSVGLNPVLIQSTNMPMWSRKKHVGKAYFIVSDLNNVAWDEVLVDWRSVINPEPLCIRAE